MSSLIYSTFFVLNILLAKLYETSVNSKKLSNVLIVVIWIFFVTFVSIRYDVGNDYANYVGHFWYIKNLNGFITPDYIIFEYLTKLFSFTEYGYIGVFSLYFIFTFSLILLILKRYNIVLWGLFVFITFGYFFDTLDRIRQLAALAVFLYSIEDIMKNKFLSFFTKILIASLFHFSAFILVPFYFIAKVPISRVTATIWFFTLLIGYFLGVWVNLIEYIYSYVPYYNTIYQDSLHSEKIDALATGLGFLGKVFFVFFNILFSPINSKYKMLLMIGLTFYIIGLGNLNIERVADYFLAVTIISFPYLVKYFKKIENKLLLLFPMILFLIIFFIKSLSQEYFQYQTIFSDEFRVQKLKERIYN